ncbi:MAG: hypothetical protein LBS10_08445 [Gracilibacteraceae bacterium]|jgi:hypothetical protein|nr:hypothetical protein [Gracilibacteraceae bacterium]
MKKLNRGLTALILAALLLLPAAFPAAAEAESESLVLQVVLPAELEITIDPLEISGCGQIYSGVYAIGNHGDTDVLLTITDYGVSFAGEGDFEALAEPFPEGAEAGDKAIYLVLDFGLADTPPLVLTDRTARTEIVIPLPAGENAAAHLSFSGSVNPYPGTDWQSGEVKFYLTYRLEALEPVGDAAHGLPPPDEPPEPEGDTATGVPPSDDPPESVGDAAHGVPLSDEPEGDAVLGVPPPDEPEGDAALALPPPDEPEGDAATGVPPPDDPPDNVGDAALGVPPLDDPPEGDTALGVPLSDEPEGDAALGFPLPDEPPEPEGDAALGVPPPDESPDNVGDAARGVPLPDEPAGDGLPPPDEPPER